MTIRCVLFDLGGVVFDYLPDHRLRLMAAMSPLSGSEIDGALWGSGFSDDCDRGVYDARQQAVESGERAKLAMDYGEIRDAWCAAFQPNPAVVALLDRIVPEVVVGSLSNNSELIRFGMEHAWPDLLRRFQPSIWSYESRTLKPDQAAYRHAERVTRCASDEICFIDDGEANVEGAINAGWGAIRFVDTTSLEAALDERALLAPGGE